MNFVLKLDSLIIYIEIFFKRLSFILLCTIVHNLSKLIKNQLFADHPAFKDIDKAVLKEAYSGLVTFIIEAAKHDSSEQNIG